MVDNKRCSKCGQYKPVPTGFYKDAARKGGLTPACRECHASYYKQVAPRASVQKAEAYANNPNPAKMRAAGRRQIKAEEIKRHKRERFAALPESDKVKARLALKQWKTENPAKIAANCRNRQARKLQACPPWLTKEQRAEISEFYKAAESLRKVFGVNFHVDHIVPLKGASVCGLHVPWNLQLLSATDNVNKSNNDWPGKP